MPKCKEINCGSPGPLPNGWLEGSRMNLGDVVNFKCVEGMKFEGESLSTTCQVSKIYILQLIASHKDSQERLKKYRWSYCWIFIWAFKDNTSEGPDYLSFTVSVLQFPYCNTESVIQFP